MTWHMCDFCAEALDDSDTYFCPVCTGDNAN